MASHNVTLKRKTEYLKLLLKLNGIVAPGLDIPKLVQVCKEEIPNFVEPSEALFVSKNHRLEEVGEQSSEI